MDVANGFFVLTPEIWVNVVKRIRNLYDVERLCIAFPELQAYLGTYLIHFRQQEALKCILGANALKPSQALVLREVSKQWRDVVDAYYSEPHDKSNLQDIPFVVIRIPMAEGESKLLKDLAEHTRNPLIGERVCLGLSDWTGIRAMKDIHQLLEATSHVWQGVKHLIIRVENNFVPALAEYCYRMDPMHPYRGFTAIIEPWLSQMTKVVNIVCDFAGPYAISCLPNPELLKYIRVKMYIEVNSFTEGWSGLLRQCCDTLKRFDSVRMDRYLLQAVQGLNFPNLEEFRIRTYCYQRAPRFLFEMLPANRLPKLKVIGIPLPYNLEHSSNGQGRFSKELINFTNMFHALEEIQLYSPEVPALSFESYSISICLYRKGSPNLKRLVLSPCPFTTNEQDRTCWMKGLSECFPGVHILQVGKTVMLKSKRLGWEVAFASDATFASDETCKLSRVLNDVLNN